jgi:hypothetical protein
LEKAHSLVSERGVSATAVSKRLKVPLSSVLKLRNVRKEDLDQALERRCRRSRFHKIHERARHLIEELIGNSHVPLQLRDF